MLELRHIDDFDLSGILFSLYPSHMSLEESRERLEYDIEMAHDYMQTFSDPKLNDPNDDPDVPYISPGWIYLAHYVKRIETFNGYTPKKQQKEIEKILKKWRASRPPKQLKQLHNHHNNTQK